MLGWAKETQGAASALDSILIRLEVFSEGSNPQGGGGEGGETLWLCHCSGESFDDSTTLALSGVTLKEFQNDIKRISVW